MVKVSALLERTIPIAVLALLLFYIYVELWYAPYIGFELFCFQWRNFTHVCKRAK